MQGGHDNGTMTPRCSKVAKDPLKVWRLAVWPVLHCVAAAGCNPHLNQDAYEYARTRIYMQRW